MYESPINSASSSLHEIALTGSSQSTGDVCHERSSYIEIPSSEQSSSEACLLLREFSHRINNEFTSAIGAISLAAARSANDEAKAALAAVQDQLQNYAQVHHALQLPDHSSCIDAAVYLRQLCRAISRSKLDSKGIELRLVEHPFQINSERCWRLGLIVSELITNAERHAFGSGGGLIRVELLTFTSFVECRITDNGKGEENTCPGRGLKIVEALARSLGGTIDQKFGPQGATAVLIFPLEIDTTKRLADERVIVLRR
jgi:two-component sensor histidine kinase